MGHDRHHVYLCVHMLTTAPIRFTTLRQSPSKRRRRDPESDEVLSREWGNVSVPKGNGASSKSSLMDLSFHEVTEEADLLDRYVFVNRAPVMTAWATIVLERLGFKRPEALSIGEWAL